MFPVAGFIPEYIYPVWKIRIDEGYQQVLAGILIIPGIIHLAAVTLVITVPSNQDQVIPVGSFYSPGCPPELFEPGTDGGTA
jgi:hypothetical protein